MISVYSRDESQFSLYVPSQLLGHRPWIVQESVGPVTGLVSQNWTCWKRPPGLLIQQVSVEEPEQDNSSEVSAHVS